MNLDALKSELASGHPVTGPYSADAETATAELNAANRTVNRPIPMRDVVRWAARHDAVFKLETNAATGQQQVRAVCKAALVIMNSPHVETLDLQDAEIDGMLGALVSAGVFTADQKDDLVAMGANIVSRAEELGLPVVAVGNVIEARRLP